MQNFQAWTSKVSLTMQRLRAVGESSSNGAARARYNGARWRARPKGLEGMSTESKKPNEPGAETKPARSAAGRQGGTELWSPPLEPDGLAQLREILFGPTVRDVERRLQRADAHLIARAQELELEHRRRIDVVEAHLRKETEMLGARFERESVEKGETVRAIAREQRETTAAVDQRMSKLEETILRVQRELRDQLLDQAKQFLDEIHQLRREMAETLERELGLAQRLLAEEAGYGAGPAPH